jgi:hypothetical protein
MGSPAAHRVRRSAWSRIPLSTVLRIEELRAGKHAIDEWIEEIVWTKERILLCIPEGQRNAEN